MAAKLAGRAPGGGRGDKETTVTRRDSIGGSKSSKGSKPSPASGTDADRWDRKKDTRPSQPGPEVYRAPSGRGDGRGGVNARLGDKRNDGGVHDSHVKPRVVPKVVIHRPFS